MDSEKILNTNNSWKCLQDKAYNALQPELVYSYYAAGPTEKINYNEYPVNWQQQNYNDESWQQAQQLFNGLPKGVFYWTLGWMLIPRSIPPMEITPQRLQTIRTAKGIEIGTDFLNGKKSFTVPANTSVTVLIDQGFLTTAYPVLQFSNGKNAVIDISYSEALYVDEGTKKDWLGMISFGSIFGLIGFWWFVGLLGVRVTPHLHTMRATAFPRDETGQFPE